MAYISKKEYDELKSVVETAKFLEYEEISYLGIDILLLPCEHTLHDQEIKLPPIFYKSSDIADYDIYFGTNVVPVDFRKPCLLHEIIEIGLVEKIKNWPGITHEQLFTLAHKTAKRYDRKYALETLLEAQYLEYENLRKTLSAGNLPNLK